MAILEGQPLPSMSPDCVLFTSQSSLIPPDRKCCCKKEKMSNLDQAHDVLHRLFYNRCVFIRSHFPRMYVLIS
jgi:hypothetical protein